MHEESRKHQCPKCGKIFTKLFNLREHDNTVHLKLRPFKCSFCDLTFGIRKTLKTHERQHDSAGRPESCTSCNAYFKTKRALLLHNSRVHSEHSKYKKELIKKTDCQDEQVTRQTEVYLRSFLDDEQTNPEESEEEKEGHNEEDCHEEYNSSLVTEPEIVVKELPACDTIQSDLCDNDKGEFNYDFDNEMLIEVPIKSDLHEDAGIDLDAVVIKQEPESDDGLHSILKSEVVEPLPYDSFEQETKTKEKITKTEEIPEVKEEFEDWNFPPKDSDSDSDCAERKQKKKQTRKRKTKQKTLKKILGNTSCARRTKSIEKGNAENKDENQTTNSDDKTQNETCSALSSVDKIALNKNSTDRPKRSKGSRVIITCTECEKNFYKEYMYQAHMKGVHQGVKKPFECQHCDSSFRFFHILNRHFNTKHASQIASACSDGDSLKAKLQTHICKFCQRPFTRKDSLKQHIRAVHEGVRPFQCTMCDKAFSFKNILLRHEKRHSDERPFACEYCSKRYKNEADLRYHLKRHTTNPDLLRPKRKQVKPTVEGHIAIRKASRQYLCSKCGKVFNKLSNLQEHENAVHLKLRPYKCNLCGLSFGISKTLRTHERRHGLVGRPEFCIFCNLYFKTYTALALHNEIAHPERSREELRIST